MVGAQRGEIGVFHRYDSGQQVLQVVGHHLGMDWLGAQAPDVSPVDRGRNVGEPQPGPQRRFLAPQGGYSPPPNSAASLESQASNSLCSVRTV